MGWSELNLRKCEGFVSTDHADAIQHRRRPALQIFVQKGEPYGFDQLQVAFRPWLQLRDGRFFREELLGPEFLPEVGGNRDTHEAEVLFHFRG